MLRHGRARPYPSYLNILENHKTTMIHCGFRQMVRLVLAALREHDVAALRCSSGESCGDDDAVSVSNISCSHRRVLTSYHAWPQCTTVMTRHSSAASCITCPVNLDHGCEQTGYENTGPVRLYVWKLEPDGVPTPSGIAELHRAAAPDAFPRQSSSGNGATAAARWHKRSILLTGRNSTTG